MALKKVLMDNEKEGVCTYIFSDFSCFVMSREDNVKFKFIKIHWLQEG